MGGDEFDRGFGSGLTRFRPNAQAMLHRWSRAFRPKQRFSTAEWIEQHVVIPPTIGATPGRYSLVGREYLLGPLDAVDDPEVCEIVLKLPTQVGKTTLLQALLQSRSDTCPSPAMLAGPDQDEILKLRDDFYAMCEASQRLRNRIPPPRLRNDRWIDFCGIRCYLAWAGNTQRLAGKSCQMVLATEIDKWPNPAPDAKKQKEGNRQALVRNRVKAWFRYLILWESTPTDENSAISAQYETSNKCRYQMPCPHCWHYQALRMHVLKDGPFSGCGGIGGIQKSDGSFVTSDEAIRDAYYICEQGCRIENEDKSWMVANGAWVPEGQSVEVLTPAKKRKGSVRPERLAWQLIGTPLRSVRVSGFQMTSLVSATISFGKYAEAWLKAKDDDALLQDFVNNWEGERWVKKAKVLKWDKLHQRLKGGHPRGYVPSGAFFLTCGSDVQGDRCYYVVRAWGEGGTSWLVDWGCCLQAYNADGQATYNSDLNQLDGLVLNRTFPMVTANAAGYQALQVRLLGTDCQYQSHRVWNWVRLRNQERVRCVAGDSQMAEAFYRMTVVERSARDGRPYPGGMRRWGINTLTYKVDIQGRWQLPLNEPGVWFLLGESREAMEVYLKQVTNEGPLTRINSKGRPETVWVVLETALGNHYWDCEVYARALADMVTGGDFTNLAARVAPQTGRKAGEPQEGFAARD